MFVSLFSGHASYV